MTSKRFTSVTGYILSLAAMFLVAVWVAAAGLMWSTRDEALSASQAQAVRFVSGAETALNRGLLGVDVLLAGMDELLGLSGLIADWIDVKTTSRSMAGVVLQNLLVRHVTLLDAGGRVLASSDPSGADLKPSVPAGFVDEVLAQAVSTMLVSAPVVSFTSSEQVLYFARSIRLADGSKVVAAAEVQVPSIATILVQGVDISGLEVTLERGNGQLLASMPALAQRLGERLEPALGARGDTTRALQAPARLSGAPALIVARPILYGDILIAASIPIDSALAHWRTQRDLMVVVSIVFSLMILAAGGFAAWYMERLAQARRTISQSKGTLDQALESMVSGFVLLNADYQVVSWNRRFVEFYPWVGRVMAPLLPFQRVLEVAAMHHLPDASEAERQDWVARRVALQWSAEGTHEQRLPSGKIIQIAERRTPEGGVVIVYQDVTELREASAAIEQLAFYDSLTGLPNRRLLLDRLQQAEAASARSGKRGALLFIDLDHFKTLNDTRGHDVGDLLLQQVASRLKACVREGDTVARLGGDEFVVMLDGLSGQPLEAATQTRLVGEKVIASLNQPYQLAQHSHTSTPSIGATLFGGAHLASADLLKQADIAMYQVKSSGRNALCFFDPAMQVSIAHRAEMERDLRLAIAADQFQLYYQTQVSHDESAVGAEVLIRWFHPERGMVSPLEFITLAEETGLIIPIGLWVLRTACAQLKVWDEVPGRSDLQLAVNVSARQFRQADFVNQVRSVLDETGARPNRIKLELTESMVLDNVQDTIEKMHALKRLGVRFSMDDFGTGQSSLSYLTRLPLDQLKIDQSFVRNIGVAVTDAVIIQTIIGMARNLGLEVIAEGVETADQRAFLALHGCQLCQGFLFSRPLPLAEFESLLGAA
ncbi:EAL domain-containing protein [Rhodoferax sp.]|uniref:bifunctional diguanylate cyclase/phosphodiesterase n=1 Tax=Rhodoferax sp. TaxID=50421 RepID=UPI00274BF569|nr:EAL domain-containing protein [Rhodoferax sp.]